MKKPLKIAVIGAGSSYTPELVEGLIEQWDELPVRQLLLMDINRRRLDIIGGLAQRMVTASGHDIEVLTTLDRVEAITDAQFVISQIRVGGMDARIKDEKIPPQYGSIGQETTGPGGLAKALRTIPVALSIAREMEEHAPGAFLLNFTNPAGLITEALLRYSGVPTIGLCNLPIGAEMRLAEAFGFERSQLQLDWVGLNHLNWIRGATIDGEDVWPALFQRELAEARQREDDGWNFSAEILETMGMIPCGYLNYYYHHDQVLKRQLVAEQSRGEEVKEIERELMALYQDPDLKEKPALLEQRGGAYYSKAAISLISALANNKQEIHIVNTRNNGAIPGLPDDVVVEVAATIGSAGAAPIPVAPMPPEIRGLVQAVKSYELLAAITGAKGDRRRAVQALVAHPLVSSFEAAEGVLDALLEAHKEYLPQFFPGG